MSGVLLGGIMKGKLLQFSVIYTIHFKQKVFGSVLVINYVLTLQFQPYLFCLKTTIRLIKLTR